MLTLGIDVAKYTHNATLLDAEGHKVFANFSFNNDQSGLDKLLEKIAAGGSTPEQIVIGMEATGHYWILLFEHLVKAGFDVKVINPIVTRARRNITVRGGKTDAADSLLIAGILREGSVKVSAIPEDEVNRLRTLTRLRFDCAKAASSEKLRLIALLDVVFPEYKNHFSDVFGASSRVILSHFPTAAELAKVDIRRLTALLCDASRGRKGREDAVRLKEAARNSFARDLSDRNLALEIRFVVERLNLVVDQIAELDQEIKNYYKDLQTLLKTVPGIADVWAPTILAEVLPVFHPERRNGSDAFVAMAGLDPRHNDSGRSTGRAKMSKRGSKYLRTAVMEASEVAIGWSNDPMFKSIYDRQRAEGKPHMVALSHVANKMLRVIFALLKTKEAYHPVLNN